jgi:shikimate dehydrogenase
MAIGNFAITGRTRLLAIIGDPIDHVKAPLMINTRLAEYGLAGEAVIVPIQVKPEGLATILESLRALPNFKGAIITMPHKASVISLIDEIAPEAKQLGACNVVRRDADGRYVGTMFDGEALAAGLQQIGQDVKGKSVFLVGGGGVAAGIAFALAKHGARSITLRNRTMAKAHAIAARLRQAMPNVIVDCEGPKGQYDLVVNATSMGMKEDHPLPIPIELLNRDTVVADVVTQPDPTPLVIAARERGCVILTGKGMLAAQLNLMIEYILDKQLEAP